jgi:hypothetical protein
MVGFTPPAPPPFPRPAVCAHTPRSDTVATLSENGVLTVSWPELIKNKWGTRDTAYDPGDPQYPDMLSRVRGIKPGEVMCVGASGLNSEEIGTAKLQDNGFLVVYISFIPPHMPPGMLIEPSGYVYRPTDPNYDALMKRFLDIKVGETRLVFRPEPPRPASDASPPAKPRRLAKSR